MTEAALIEHPITVFDWAYTDPKTGRPSYAGTPERAGKLIAEGVELRPVYDIANAKSVQTLLSATPAEIVVYHLQEAIKAAVPAGLYLKIRVEAAPAPAPQPGGK